MSEYKLEVKQIVNYPRCRIYREFIQSLITDQNICTNGSSGLFHYTVLYSYANFRTSYRRLDGISYTVFPGDWICRLTELMESLRLRSRRQVIQVLERLQERGYIQYTLLGRGHIVKYRIKGWHRHNTILDYNCPCQKDTGFFFLPVSVATELISAERCSEMDIILGLWLSTIYNDTRVQGSFAGPVVYFRNGSGCPLVSYSDLSYRWGISKSAVSRILKKLEQHVYISLLTFPGRHGTVIYLQNYLSTMFQISDVMIDKDEVAMSLNIKINIPETESQEENGKASTVSKADIIVSKSNLDRIASKVLQLLALQGISCAECSKISYMLYPLSDDCIGKLEVETIIQKLPQFKMEIGCINSGPLYTFLLTVVEIDREHGGNSNG